MNLLDNVRAYLDNIPAYIEREFLSGYSISSEGYRADMEALCNRLPITLSKIAGRPNLYLNTTHENFYQFKVSLLNLTDFNINIEANGNIYIKLENDTRSIGKIDCKVQAVAYCLKDYPQLLCFETNKLKNSYLRRERLFVDTSQPDSELEIDTEGKIDYLSKKKTFTLILLSATDENSDFSIIPQHLMTCIALQYDECLKKMTS